MNERIKELTEQLIKQFTTNLFNKSGLDVREYEPFLEEAERFAELIVRECSLTLYKSAVQDKQAGFAHEAKIMELAGDMIKQHFGVE